MKKNLIAAIVVAALAVAFLSACGQTVRSVTHTSWWETSGGSRVYVCYWEGSCSGFGGCSKGESKIKKCDVQADNTLKCEQMTEAEKVLNPHMK
ncbi:MAG: hypothetical protein HY897_08075 [Deltaproteobacteria bacterium]|nr:hypothetical protein [Deltaproteobacteria bacterium]